MSSYEQKTQEWIMELRKIRVLLLGIFFTLTLLLITLTTITYFHFLHLQEWCSMLETKIESLENHLLTLQQIIDPASLPRENSDGLLDKKFSGHSSKYHNPVSSFFETVGQYTMWGIKSSFHFFSGIVDTFSKEK